MLFIIKNKHGLYYCGMNMWDKQLRKAKIYTSFKMAAQLRDRPGLFEGEPLIYRVTLQEECAYNPDLEG